MTPEKQSESLQFRAEVQQLLNILSRSLYTDQEIFLRELISNASDALHRVQFEMLTQRELLDPEAELAIRVDYDEETKTITVTDTGIGMTREELIENLGTIAHSGATAFLKNLEEGKRPEDIIGQFGVGFYSVFMVADEVRVTSRSYLPEADAWTWISQGDDSYTIEPAAKSDRGTEVKIMLKEDAEGFASAWRLEQIVKKHSNYVSFPIYVDEKVVNQQAAIWRQSPSEISEEEYEEFYRQLTLDFKAPLLHLHVRADVPVELRSILYVPSHRDQGPLRASAEHGLKLYSKKILIQENNTDMLPPYLRFVEGVVDSADIPLNISRETVQSSRTMNHIKKALRGRLVKALVELGEERPEDYATFWNEFGPFIKEGVATDFANRDDLLPLLRFYSSKSGEDLISLETYAGRMAEGQEAIYYILGDDVSSVTNSPHLDYFKAHDLEVLYLLDPLDAFMVQSLHDYEDQPLKSVSDPDLELPEMEKEEAAEAAPEVEQGTFETLVERFREVLGERIVEVRESGMLKGSPARLVSSEKGPQRDMERVRRLLEENYQLAPRIVEINRGHPLIRNLAQLVEQRPDHPLLDPAIEQLFENLLLLEGLHPNPAQMVPRLQDLLERATGSAAEDV